MAVIQHVHRRGAVYWWRRRLPFGDGRTGTLRVEVSLRTRYPRAARRIAAEVTCACERLKGRRPGEMLTPDEMRRVLASVARRHAAKLDAVAAVEMADGGALDVARSTELAMGWAMRMLAAHGTQADIDPGFADEMLASGLDRETMALAFQFVAEHHRSGLSKPQPARLERLLEELDIDPSPGNLAQAAQLHYRGLSMALLDVDRRWRGRRVEDQALMDAMHLEGAGPAGSAARGTPRGTVGAATGVQEPPDRFEDAAPAGPQQAAPAPPAHEPDEVDAEAPVPAAAEQVSIIGQAEQLAREKRQLGEWTEKTASQVRSIAHLFSRLLGHDNACRIVQADVARYRSLLLKLPKTYGKSPADRDRPLEEVLERAATLPPEQVGVGPGTLNRHLTQLKGLLDYAAASGHLAERLESVSQLRARRMRRARDDRAAFTDEEASAMFALPVWTGCAGQGQRLVPGDVVLHDSLYWMPLIALYSGLRREEACGLMVADFGVEDTTAFLHVRGNAYRRIKNQQSERRLPLHEELVRLGLREFVAAVEARGHDMLFPELRAAAAGKPLGDVFYGDYIKVQNAAIPDARARKKAFHSFRHWVNQAMKSAWVMEEVRADILGHGGSSMTTERYASAARLVQMRQAIAKVPAITIRLKRHPIHLPELVVRRPRRSPRSRSTGG